MAENDFAECPNCGEMVEMDFYNEIGDEISCPSCDVALRITSTEPLRVRIVKKVASFDEYPDSNDYGDSF